jgi:hypothetical protein
LSKVTAAVACIGIWTTDFRADQVNTAPLDFPRR